MDKEKLILEQHEVIVEKQEQLEKKDQEIKDLKQEIHELTELELLQKHVKETEEYEKKEHKFNVKAWLIASSFAIVSCCLGITNLVLGLVRK